MNSHHSDLEADIFPIKLLTHILMKKLRISSEGRDFRPSREEPFDMISIPFSTYVPRSTTCKRETRTPRLFMVANPHGKIAFQRLYQFTVAENWRFEHHALTSTHSLAGRLTTFVINFPYYIWRNASESNGIRD